jgi:hypothetical protein
VTQNRNPPDGAASMPAVWPATITSAVLVAQLIAGKATRDALFLTHFEIAQLPGAMIGAAILSALSVLVVSRALSTIGPARVLPALFCASAILFALAFGLHAKSERAAALAIYAHTAVINLALGSAFWSLVNERFDPHTAKRLVGRLASAGTLGGVIGGLIAWGTSVYRSVPVMLVLLAAMSAVGLWSSLRFAQRTQKPAPSTALVNASGFKVFGETPYLRDVALLVTAAAATQALLDWLFSAHASHLYEGEELLRFFAVFNVAVSVLSFLAQSLLTRVILEKQGLGGAIKLQSASVAAAVLLALAAPIFLPVLITRVVEQVTRSSLYRSAYELFFTPLPSAKKRPTKMIIDVGVDRIGTALGSAGLFAIAHSGASLAADARLELQTRITLLGVLALSAAVVYIATRLQRGYVAALAASLQSGAIALADADVEDLTTRTTLAETNAQIDRRQLLARIEQFQARKSQRPSSEPSSAIEALRSQTPEQLVLALRDPVSEVRAGAAQVLAELTSTSSLAREPLAIAYRALRADDAALRGTALEYIEVVLPPDIRERLMPLLGDVKAPRRRRPRGSKELADELLKSQV